jgi:uncharacterized NAD(P)/FAD-binding protein YdhS
MNNTQIILQYGGFGVIAVFFYLLMRRDWKRQDLDRAEFKDLLRENKEAFGEVTKQSTKFADSVDNHMDTNTKALQEMAESNRKSFDKLTEAIERLCRMWNNK